jgi:hypothetical protein
MARNLENTMRVRQSLQFGWVGCFLVGAMAPSVPMTEFMNFTKIPIVIYYGDNIPEAPTAIPGEEQWRVFLHAARLWVDAVNRHGGDATVVHLPESGIRGNTHFPFADLNNIQIADQLSGFLKAKNLD